MNGGYTGHRIAAAKLVIARVSGFIDFQLPPMLPPICFGALTVTFPYWCLFWRVILPIIGVQFIGLAQGRPWQILTNGPGF